MKTVLITGSKGFVGKNLVQTLSYIKEINVLEFSRNDNVDNLQNLVNQSDFVFHLAGENRPQDTNQFSIVNTEFTKTVVQCLKNSGKKIPLLFTSSTQASLDNLYGKSKKNAEDAIFSYGKEVGGDVFVYRLPNVFGKWSRPNYNSAIATFCHNIARDLPIQVNDVNAKLSLVYIDDVVQSFIDALFGAIPYNQSFCEVSPVHEILLGDLVELIKSFKQSRINRNIPDMSNPLTKKLYSTYLNFLPTDQFNYPLQMHVDDRGSFTEFIKTVDRGQVSVNISKPGITKGNHWHHTKNEKFLVVSGVGTVNFRAVDGEEITTYHVSGEKLEVIDIPTGYTHNIINTGTSDLVTIMWANEAFNPQLPDTNFLPV